MFNLQDSIIYYWDILKKSKQYRTLFYEKTIGELEKVAKQSSLASIANKNNKTVNKELLNLLKQLYLSGLKLTTILRFLYISSCEIFSGGKIRFF